MSRRGVQEDAGSSSPLWGESDRREEPRVSARAERSRRAAIRATQSAAEARAMASWLYDPRHPHRSKPRSSPGGPPPPNSASPTLPKTAVRQNWTGPRSSERGASSAAFRILRSCRKTGPKNGVGREVEVVCGRGHQTEVHAKKGPPIGRFCRGSAETAFSRCVESVQCRGRKFAPGVGLVFGVGEGGGGRANSLGMAYGIEGQLFASEVGRANGRARAMPCWVFRAALVTTSARGPPTRQRIDGSRGVVGG